MATPIRTLTYDSPLLVLRPGSPTPGHDFGHIVARTEWYSDHNGTWLHVQCSCGEVFGGCFARAYLASATRQEREAIEVEGRPSFVIAHEGPPMTGTCPGCGANLDALARSGKIGHACFGPGDEINYERPN